MTPERYAQIKELFTRAVELSDDERAAFLADQCKNDAPLRRDVESLLQHDAPLTIISTKETTVADFSDKTVVAAKQRRLSHRIQSLSNLTRHLGPRGHLAIGALISCIVLALLGYGGNHAVLAYQKDLRREALNEIVDGKVLALEMWLGHETEKIESWARSNELRRHISQLVQLAAAAPELPDDFAQTPPQQAIREELHTLAGFEVFFSIWDRRHLLIADTFTEVDRTGDSATPWGAGILAVVFEGRSQLITLDQQNTITHFDSSIRVDPHLGVVTPIRDDDEQIIAALLVHDDDSRQDASRILGMLRLGESGESYTFNRDGLMLSESRFDVQLRQLGLIPGDPDSVSSRTIYLRDPGGDLTAGYEPEEPLSARPLTKMARLCTAGNDGDDLDGYRDYRGVKVVGAWRWLDDLRVGVATELDFNEAQPGLQVLIWETWVIAGLIALCTGIATFSFYSVHRLRQQVGEHRKLGQYTLEKQIGQGGMGKVFKARHELLKRPTAIKLLRPELIDQESTARFQREARLVSGLEHPNTIRVYDYGVTPEGLFFYVMEYIDGLSLVELVDLQQTLPPSRVIFLLRQICYSLREAHDAELVHRDLKPANIMVCSRGGEFDVVKVLDFGLVKHIQTSASQQITSTAVVAGTPQYIAPERLSEPETNDPRSDIYSLGAVAYFLLTGQDFIQGGSLAKILFQVVNAPPARPSEVTGTEIPAAVDELVYRCLAKDPKDRPASVTEILTALDSSEDATAWTVSDAESWWRAHASRFQSPSAQTTAS